MNSILRTLASTGLRSVFSLVLLTILWYNKGIEQPVETIVDNAPLPQDILGEYRVSNHVSHKFWSCVADGQGTYTIQWGPINDPRGKQTNVDRKKALTKIREKQREGYLHKDRPEAATVGLQRLILEAMFEKGSTQLKSRRRATTVVEVVEEPVVVHARPRRRL